MNNITKEKYLPKSIHNFIVSCPIVANKIDSLQSLSIDIVDGKKLLVCNPMFYVNLWVTYNKNEYLQSKFTH